MIFGLFYFCVVILCVNRSRTSFILYRIVKRHSRQFEEYGHAQTMNKTCSPFRCHVIKLNRELRRLRSTTDVRPAKEKERSRNTRILFRFRKRAAFGKEYSQIFIFFNNF